jgi:hypothetical protein
VRSGWQGSCLVQTDMRRVLACVLAGVVGLHPAAAWAGQESRPDATRVQPRPGEVPAQSPPSVESLGMSFERIKRELRILPPSTAKTALKIEYYVEVQGLAPPIPIFRPGELTTGPVPYGAPTHRDMLDHVTPIAFKSPAIPVSAIAIMGIQMLVQWEATRAREERLARKRQAEIDEERERQRRLKESILLSPPK